MQDETEHDILTRGYLPSALNGMRGLRPMTPEDATAYVNADTEEEASEIAEKYVYQ